MAILITGARGFVGRCLADSLKKGGFELILFDGDVSDARVTENFKTEKKIDAVIHLAGVTNKKNEKVFYQVNVVGTKNIVSLCKRVNVGRIIFSSSIRALSLLKNPYSVSKREAEEVIIDSGVPYVILRPSIVYGPGDKKNIGMFLKIAKAFPVMPVFGFKMQPLFVEDLAGAIVASLKIPVNKVINVTGPQVVSFREFLNILKSLNFGFYAVNMPHFFNFLLKAVSYFPFSPFCPWQVRGLLAGEIVDDASWQKFFGIPATSFDKGILKTLNKNISLWV